VERGMRNCLYEKIANSKLETFRTEVSGLRFKVEAAVLKSL
jgi:hypothetical protein